MKINLDGYFVRIVGFLADGVSPDYSQQFSAFDMGKRYSPHPNIKIHLDSCLAENCRFPADGVDPK